MKSVLLFFVFIGSVASLLTPGAPIGGIILVIMLLAAAAGDGYNPDPGPEPPAKKR